MQRYLTPLLYLAAAGLLVLGIIFPLWRVLLYFPQYPEGPLQVVAFAGHLAGDLSEIEMLNHYIGVVMPTQIPELDLLPKLLIVVAVLAAVAALLRGRAGLWLRGSTLGVLAATGTITLWRINGYLTDFGANPDPTAPLAGVMKPFKPPLWGKAVIVQVEAEAGFLAGTWFLAVAGLFLVLGFWLTLRQHRLATK